MRADNLEKGDSVEYYGASYQVVAKDRQFIHLVGDDDWMMLIPLDYDLEENEPGEFVLVPKDPQRQTRARAVWLLVLAAAMVLAGIVYSRYGGLP